MNYVDKIQDRDGTDYALKATIESVSATAESVAATAPVSVTAAVDDGAISFDFHIPAASTANADAAAQEARDAADACEAATSAANTAATGATTAAQNAVNATVDTVHATQEARATIADVQAATASANAAASAANTAKDATIAATTAANEATTAATTATSNANTATANANAATTAANAAAARADASADAADTATDDANAAAARAEEAARPTEEMFASYHALLKAGASEGIASDADPVQSSFLNRASGSAEGVRDGIATIECIKGNTVGWNQLLNLDVRTVTNDGLTVAAATDGSVTLTGAPETGTVFVRLNSTTNLMDIVQGHKYVVKGGSRARGIYIGIDGVGSVYPDAIYTSNVSGSRLAYINVPLAADLSTTFKSYPQLFDLTKIFGTGNEPATVAEFEALYPEPYYPYDPGTLKPVQFEGMETVGFNQLNIEDSYIYNDYRCIDIPVGETNMLNISFIDKDTSVDMSGIMVGFMKTGAATPLKGTEFVWNYQNKSVSASHNNVSTNGNNLLGTLMIYPKTEAAFTKLVNRFDICVNIEQNGYRNGEYESYWRSQREIAIAEHFPTGMKAAGTAADMLYKDHADHVIGEVDLGTLNWTKSGSISGLFMLNGATKVPGAAPAVVPGNYQISAAYTNHQVSIDSMNDKTYKMGNGNYTGIVYIRDTAFNDKTADEFEAAMSGVMLYYELADSAKTTEVIDPPLNLGYRVSSDGTERVMLADGVISAPPIFEIAYGYTAESLRDAAASIVAPVENHLAQDNYAIGSYLVRDGVLYKVTAAIARNEAIVPGTNVTATTVMAELAAING